MEVAPRCTLFTLFILFKLLYIYNIREDLNDFGTG